MLAFDWPQKIAYIHTGQPTSFRDSACPLELQFSSTVRLVARPAPVFQDSA